MLPWALGGGRRRLRLGPHAPGLTPGSDHRFALNVTAGNGSRSASNSCRTNEGGRTERVGWYQRADRPCLKTLPLIILVAPKVVPLPLPDGNGPTLQACVGHGNDDSQCAAVAAGGPAGGGQRGRNGRQRPGAAGRLALL
jgi:hypothetical protein